MNSVIEKVKLRSRGVYSIGINSCDGTKIYEISEGTYREIGSPLSGRYIDGDTLDAIVLEDERRRCMKRALRVLEYADKSRSALYTKLLSLGFSRGAAAFATSECERLGYIDEGRTLRRAVLSLSERDLLGPRRIYSRLLSRGYRSATVSAVISELSQSGELDFDESKRRLLERKQPQNEEEERALLYKYGYLYD